MWHKNRDPVALLMKAGYYLISSILLSIFMIFSAFWFTDIGQQTPSDPAAVIIERAGVGLALTPFAGPAADKFFADLGYSKPQAHAIRKVGCLFWLQIENKASPEPVSGGIEGWKVSTGGEDYTPWTLAVWKRYLDNLKLPAVAYLGFENTLIREAVTLKTGEHAAGLVGFALPPGKSFAVVVQWRAGAGSHHIRFDKLTCPDLSIAATSSSP